MLIIVETNPRSKRTDRSDACCSSINYRWASLCIWQDGFCIRWSEASSC